MPTVSYLFPFEKIEDKLSINWNDHYYCKSSSVILLVEIQELKSQTDC